MSRWKLFNTFGLIERCRRLGIPPTRHLLLVSATNQTMLWLEATFLDHPATAPTGRTGSFRRNDGCVVMLPFRPGLFISYRLVEMLRISTSRLGMGQVANSNQTPLGLHRIAAKVGGGQPLGTVFRSRRPIGLTWKGHPGGSIAHRILWLEGLEPGRNRGGSVDTHSRYIYIHGVGDEPTLGRPASRGCIHLAAADLLPLFDKVPAGTLVWITGSPAQGPSAPSFEDAKLPE